MRIRIAVLCSDGPHHKFLVRSLASDFNIVSVVEEPAAAQIQRLRQKRKWRDWLWWNYHEVRRRLLRLDAYRQRYFANAPKVPSNRFPTPIKVAWINDSETIHTLNRTKPDITVVMGTSILKKPVLRIAGLVINIHGGYLPDFRGNHCFFWALYENRQDRIGSTIHFIDEGIDTGDIIEHIVPRIFPSDNAEMLYCRAEKLAVQRLVELLKSYEAGHPLPRHPQDSGGSMYRTRDRKPYHDIILWARRNWLYWSVGGGGRR